MAKTVDIKISFQTFNCQPGREEYDKFERNLFAHGGTSDNEGWSLADCLMRTDDGAVDAAGNPMPGVTAIPAAGGGNQGNSQRTCRRKRLKESYSYIIKHIDNPDVLRALAQAPYLMDGPLALDYIRSRCRTAMDVVDTQDKQAQWQAITIAKDIGVNENTIMELDTMLMTINNDLPAGISYSEDQTCEKILREIAAASRTFQVTATTELNAREGPPGQPLTRQFQQGLVALGTPRLRDKNAMLAWFHAQWRAAVKNGTIAKSAPTSRHPGKPRATVESGHSMRHASLDSVDTALVLSSGVEAPSFTGRHVSPARTLGALQEAGFSVRRGLTTTTDFEALPATDLALAIRGEPCEDDTTEIGFSLEHAFDADGAESVDVICRGCRGIGHLVKHCPSPKKYRSLDYCITLLRNAKARAEGNARERGGAAGGNRPPPRGQRAPFQPGLPRRFQQSAAPFRRFVKNTNATNDKARLAEEGEDQSGGDNEEIQLATETIQSASILQREAPSMPTTFSDEHFQEKASVFTESRPDEVCYPCRGIGHPPGPEYPPGITVGTPIQPGPRPRPITLVGIIGIFMAIIAAFASLIESTATQWVRATVRSVWDVIPTLVFGLMGGSLTILMIIIAIAGRADALQLSARAGTVAKPTARVIEKIHAITKEHIYNLDAEIQRPGGLHLEPDLIEGDGKLFWTVDSGATAICIPVEDEWMLDRVTDAHPSIGVEAADGVQLSVKTVGVINADGQLPGKIGIETYEIKGNHWVKNDTPSYPTMSRVLVTEGLKRGTRLAGVAPLKRDGHFAYFNKDNAAALEDCLRLRNGRYALFTNDPKHYEIVFHVAPMPGVEKAQMSRDARRSALEVHASLMHCNSTAVRGSSIRISGFDLDLLTVEASDCLGCRLGKTKAPAHRRSTAPSQGGTRVPPGTRGAREPSSTGYDHFGQRIDSDISTTFPASWPHGFTAAIDFCDRSSADVFYFFLVRRTGSEVASAAHEFVRRVKGRLADGTIGRWHVDNDLSFMGPDVESFAAELVEQATSRVPYDSNTNAVAERQLGTVKMAAKAALAYAGAPEVLWPWAIAQYEHVRHFIRTEALSPPASPYARAHPGAGPADLSWAKPLFCDVTVHLPSRDAQGKLAFTGSDGCYLGRDFKRAADYVYLPTQGRISSFTVTDWRPNSFTICRGITADTPVEYREPQDLRMSPVTASLIPKHLTAGRPRSANAARAECASMQKKEGDATVQKTEGDTAVETARVILENARIIEEGVTALQKAGEQQFVQGAVRESQTSHGSAADAALASSELDSDLEIHIVGTESAKQVVLASNIVKIASVADAMKSPYWDVIKSAMEDEISGKIANEFASVVKREPSMHVMKVKWVIVVALNDDGSVKKVKARLVGCGYSQVEKVDYDEVYAHSLPAVCFRLFVTILADEDLESDQIDAVKAFTQADVDRELYSEMPEGFRTPGHVLLLHKCLEGIKQGAHLWYKKNKWAMNKCGLVSDSAEPNLYTHGTLQIVAAVVTDDVGVGFHHSVRTEYLSIRNEYAKLIKIDSPGPDLTRPLTVFTGCELTRNRQARTITVTMRNYIQKLAIRYKGKFTLNDLPYAASKAKREEFESFKPSTDGATIDRTEYLNALGSIGWPTVMLRCECSYAYSILGSLSMGPTAAHLNAVMHVVGYLVATQELGLTYGGKLRVPLGLSEMPPWFEESRGLFTSADSSWGKSPRPYGGHVVMRMNAALLWSSKAFKIVIPQSTAEAETAQASMATRDTIFVRRACEGIRRSVKGPTMLLGDNSAMMDIIKKDGTTSRSRYFERTTMLVKYAVLRLLIATQLVSTNDMMADVFTKAVDKDTFLRCRMWLFNEPIKDRSRLGKAVQALAEALCKA